MKIILANPRGFCAGVNMAIESLERALDFFGPPLYVYHEIVHNKYVVERFLRRGTVFVESLDEVPEGPPCSTAPTASRRRSASRPAAASSGAIDATCPLVTKVHLEAVKYAQEGYTIILIGHEGHDEVIGTMGEAPDRMILVETAEDVDRLDLARRRQGRLPDPDDPERRRRQRRDRRPAAEVPAGSPTRPRTTSATPPRTARRRSASWPRGPTWCSCSAARTARTASGWPRSPTRSGPHAHLIDGVAEIRPEWFEGVETVLITAGASAPEDVVQECIEYLQGRFGATIQEEWVREENVHFPLPRSLRELLPAASESGA